LISLTCGISFYFASYFAISDYEDYQLRKSRDDYFSKALSVVYAEIVSMVPCYQLCFMVGMKETSSQERALVALNKAKDQGQFDANELEGLMSSARCSFSGTYCSFFSQQTNRSFVAASRLDSSELMLDKVGPDLTNDELLYIQAELGALTDPEQREEMEAYLKEAGVPFESRAATLTV
jgi:hypothetical protein